jgi:hypothetical protein
MGLDSDGGGTNVHGRGHSQQACGPSRQWIKLALLVLLAHITPTGAQGTLGGPIDDLLLWYKLEDGTGSSAVVGLVPLRPRVAPLTELVPPSSALASTCTGLEREWVHWHPVYGRWLLQHVVWCQVF